MQLGLVVCTAVLAVYLALRQSGFEADHNAFGVPPGSSLRSEKIVWEAPQGSVANPSDVRPATFSAPMPLPQAILDVPR